MLYRGAKGMIAGPSKSRKTYLLADLAVSVASGVGWLGIPTTQVPVLYVNLELQDFAFRHRRQEIEKVKLSGAVDDYPLWSWHLRGYGVTLPLIRARLLRHCAAEGIGLIILDPTYKLNHLAQENAAEDVGRLLNEFEQVGREADATVVFCHHFAKGTAAEKHSIDRASGSGVWARDPDAIITLSPHQEDEHMIVEMHLRNFAPIAPFVVRWQYPVWERALEADPTAHRRPLKARSAAGPPRPAHRPPKVSDEQVETFVRDAFDGDTPRFESKAAAIRAAAESWGVHERTAERHLASWLRQEGQS
ncbi:MAG: helicase RepA family protein [Verrucomicrobia bacterium]|nr:helicase RepA family protein [Verrucomicrobiota bacterium]